MNKTQILERLLQLYYWNIDSDTNCQAQYLLAKLIKDLDNDISTEIYEDLAVKKGCF
jgi:hypothetical protein